ncbi:HD-GYP domain-containing protein [Aquimonas voraii]|uniref:HD-GYP domain, c-di-GMP phosphodiesterase class II (Or its inactivated variant) n=1 Tax=Aquimonas voraii TaxID=265719 RepID=A0A1G6VGV1_9GAMM|nr:HD domain-containing phosphohydrolase [Aquimonas voraii]SDD52920.1 HD-GYP domain, c-di-GMP phosphodiesterase class II (or its inactivated variant) [Aquimonas voraii]
MRPLQEEDVVLGRPLAQAVYDAEGRLLLEGGHIVRSSSVRGALLERGFVQETAAPVAEPEPDAFGGAPLATSLAMQTSVFGGLRGILETLIEVQQRLLRGDPQGLAGLRQLNDLLARYADTDVDAAMAAMQLSDPEDGLSARPIHAALLVRVLGGGAGLDADSIHSLCGAALSHDLALLPDAAALLRQDPHSGAVSAVELQQHPLQAAALLEAAGLDDPLWLDAVLHHHERLDGNGYPHRLGAERIGRGTRVLTLVDTYCAMIRPRAYGGAVQSKEALRALFLERGTAVDEGLTALFIKQVGLYPPGGIVRLASNEVAIVTRRGENTTQPQVRRLLKSDSTPDIDRIARDTADPLYAITESLPQDSYRALLRGIERLWD